MIILRLKKKLSSDSAKKAQIETMLGPTVTQGCSAIKGALDDEWVCFLILSAVPGLNSKRLKDLLQDEIADRIALTLTNAEGDEQSYAKAEK